MICAAYTNGFGEDVRSPVYAEFTDEDGFQWVVVAGRIASGNHFEVRSRSSITFMTLMSDGIMEPIPTVQMDSKGQ